jgi:hypothetical protein
MRMSHPSDAPSPFPVMCGIRRVLSSLLCVLLLQAAGAAALWLRQACLANPTLDPLNPPPAGPRPPSPQRQGG